MSFASQARLYVERRLSSRAVRVHGTPVDVVTSDRLASLTSDLLATDLPCLPPRDARAVGHATARHLASLPDGTRAGVGAAQVVVTIAASVLGRRPYSRMALDERARVVRCLAASRLPLVSEYFRLVRGVALVIYYEDVR